METKGHGTIKKSKAYGVVGVLLLFGILFATVGTSGVSADEATSNDTSNIVNVLKNNDSSDTAIENANNIDANQETSRVPDTQIQTNENKVSSETSSNEASEITENSYNTNNPETILPKNDSESATLSDETEKTSNIADDTTVKKIVDNDVNEEQRNHLDGPQEQKTNQSTAVSETNAETRKSSASGSGVAEVTSVTLGNNGFHLQYNQEISKDSKILFAVWSEIKGQDDLVWYTADPNGKATANYTGSYGKYYIHTYQNQNGKMMALNGTTIDVAPPNVKTTIKKDSATTYKVAVTDVPIYIDNIQVPIWTSANDQDDIRWYKATKATDGNYYVTFSEANHNLESGIYNVHVYGENKVTNHLTGLAVTSFKNDYSFGDVSVTTKLDEKGIQIAMPSDVSQGLTVYHAVWSTKNGQDDIKWYKVDDSGKTTALYTGDYGTYFIHTYAVVKGKMQALSAVSVDVPQPNIKVALVKASETSVRVTVSDVPVYITEIILPTWTSANNQDDIQWYHAKKQTDGTYAYTFYAKNHHFETGHYNVHVYGRSEVTHSLVGLAVTDGADLAFSKNLTNPVVTVQNHNASKGTIQVVIAETETSKDISSVQVAVWSDEKQANLHWYTSSSVVDGKTIINVDEKYHHNISGNYTIHAYVKTKEGDTVGYNVGVYALNNTEKTATVSASYKGTGIYVVSVAGVYSNGAVKYAVWSETNGQDDIRWYDAVTDGTNAISLFNAANHSNTGVYHLHVYQVDNGKMYFLTSTDFDVKRTNYDTPYYNQRDGRWGNNYYGYSSMAATGCVPTSLAMVFSSLLGTEVLPTMVADYLYHNTVEFNRGNEKGTTGRGVLMATRQWGLVPTVLNSLDSITSTLQEGHHVVAAVEQNKFSPWGIGTSHEIVLKNYSNGSVYVHDPYNASNNGWYPLSRLWNEQSTQSGDVNGLGRPFVKITDV
ncbi:MAG: GBS Bsp-like repeat-containing protein [Streptococcus sp.]|nr:GBS Bsp-like repeat-containing protein [Streptococcus sp.]